MFFSEKHGRYIFNILMHKFHKLICKNAFVLLILNRPEPGEVAQIKCVCQGAKKARLGEVLEPDIIVNVTDINGNRIKKVHSCCIIS